MFGSGLEVNGGSFLPEMCCRSCRTDLGAEAFSSSLKSPFPIVFQRPRQCILGHSIGFCQHTQMLRNSRIRLRPQPNSNVEGKTDKGCPRDTEACMSPLFAFRCLVYRSPIIQVLRKEGAGPLYPWLYITLADTSQLSFM